MEHLKKFWKWITGLFQEKSDTPDEVSQKETPTPVTQEKEDTSSTEYFASLPFEKKIEYARNGVWINKGIREFFDLRFDESLSDEDRREIAKAYAFRTEMPYNDPTVKNRVPTGLGMGDDGNQQ